MAMIFTLTAARSQLGELINRAVCGQEPVIITEHGREVAAIISVEELAALRAAADAADLRMAQRVAAGGLATVITMTTESDCYTCAREQQFDSLPPRERIAFDEHWRVAHAIDTALEAWLVLVPRRHVTTVADLTDAEAERLGSWQVRLSRALHTVTGCVKTYVVQFAEAEGFAHVHFHIVPRAMNHPHDRRGPAVFSYLSRPRHEQVTTRQMDTLGDSLRRALGR